MTPTVVGDSRQSVSIVIPMYNAAPWIEEALRSVEAQTLRPGECVVVDDGSTDEGPELVRRFAEHSECPVRLVEGSHRGVSAARNRGLAEVSGELVALMDADDVWHPTKLERQVAVLGDPDVVACTSGYAMFESGTRRVVGIVQFRNPDRAIRRWLSYEGNGMSFSSTVLLRRSAIDELGGFDERVSVCEDLELVTRLRRLGSFRVDRRILLGYRLHPDQSHRQITEMASNNERLQREVLSFEGFRPRFVRRCGANLSTHIGLVLLARGRFREAGFHLMAAARQRPVSLVLLPFYAALRRISRRGRAIIGPRWWPVVPADPDADLGLEGR